MVAWLQAWEQLYGKLMADFQTQTIKMAIS
jgi:hypothetical protein